jgi:hypothetical protein
MVGRDRRRAPRRQPHPSEPVSRVRVRAGRELAVINMSSTGVLVEGEARLLPGRHLDVHVASSGGRMLVRSRVVRSFVEGVWSDRVLYRGALAFEQPVAFARVAEEIEESVRATEGNAIPADGVVRPPPTGTAYPGHVT